MAELKPCPFCGGEATLYSEETNCDYIRNALYSVVACSDCGCRTIDDIRRTDDNLAIRDWNTRKPTIDWKPIDDLPAEPMPIILHAKSKTGRSIYLPAEILETNGEGFCLIATEGGTSSPATIKSIYTHYALLTPPEAK